MLDLNKFQVFIVGGYCRDRLLGRDCKDHDFVVVGATPQDMLDAGFQQVGADFPVFLSPLGDEFALARQERKTGSGYNGFTTTFDPSVTLEQDLIRRDLTINAMARKVVGWNEKGHAKLDDTVIDFFNGQEDLANGSLRHVGEAFGEDPVRVLRVARFAARYNFRIADDTWDLMKWMVRDGELNHLTVERVWQETSKALMEDHPEQFVHIIHMIGADRILFPETWETMVSVSRYFVNLDGYFDLQLRVAMLFAFCRKDQTQNAMERLRVPIVIQKFVNVFHDVRDFAWHGGDITARSAFDLFGRIGLARLTMADMQDVKVLLLELGPSGPSTARIELITNLALPYKHVTFDDLSDGQKLELKGKDIGRALDNIKLEAMQHLLIFGPTEQVNVIEIPELP